MSGYDLWNHPIGDLYEEMEAEGLIPECGDSEYYWPAMVLRANRLLYERLNNGNFNYDYEDDDREGFFHTLERELNWFGERKGLGRLGTLALFGNARKTYEAFSKMVELVNAHRDEWRTVKWVPRY